MAGGRHPALGRLSSLDCWPRRCNGFGKLLYTRQNLNTLQETGEIWFSNVCTVLLAQIVASLRFVGCVSWELVSSSSSVGGQWKKPQMSDVLYAKTLTSHGLSWLSNIRNCQSLPWPSSTDSHLRALQSTITSWIYAHCQKLWLFSLALSPTRRFRLSYDGS